MAEKEELKNLISKGKTKAAIDQLLTKTKDSPLHNRVVEQAARFKAYKSDEYAGAHANEELRRQSTQINRALLSLIDQVFDPATEKEEAIAKPTGTRPKKPLWEYIVAIGVIVSILGGLAEFLNFINIIPNRSGGESGQSITVLVHAKEGRDKLVLAGRGVVQLIYGQAKIEEPLNSQGEATFQEIPDRFFQPETKVELFFFDPKGEPYRASYPDSAYNLTPGQYIALQVELQGMDQLEGTVKDFVTGEPLDSVLIRIRGNSFYSNEFGEFVLDIPEDRQQQFIDISATKEGYQRWELSNVPTTTDRPIVIGLKPE